MQREQIDADEMTAEQAAEFLQIEPKHLVSLLERYGVGRYYEARHGEQFVYDRADLERIKNDLAAANDVGPPRPE
jgi:hypothetical protein